MLCMVKRQVKSTLYSHARHAAHRPAMPAGRQQRSSSIQASAGSSSTKAAAESCSRTGAGLLHAASSMQPEQACSMQPPCCSFPRFCMLRTGPRPCCMLLHPFPRPTPCGLHPCCMLHSLGPPNCSLTASTTPLLSILSQGPPIPGSGHLWPAKEVTRSQVASE